MCEVTIIIPVYNTEKHLKKAIESCLNQTFKDIEIIIINDGSTDNSLLIAQKYEAENNCVRVVTTENRGLSEARNTGLNLAKGKYIYFLDSDDWIEPLTIEQCYKLAVENKLEMVLFDSKVEVESSIKGSSLLINYDNYKRDHIVNPYNLYTGRQFIETYTNKRGVFVQAWLVFIKRDFLLNNKIRFLPKAYYEDVAFHYSCMMMAERIMYIPQAFHVRLYRDDSIMISSLNIRKVCSIYEIINEMYTCLLTNGKNIDNLWIQYLIKMIRSLHRTVLRGLSRNEIETVRQHLSDILKLQKECILLYYKLLNLIGEKVSNIRKVLEFAEEIITPLGWISDDIINILKELVLEREKYIFRIFSSLPFKKENIIIGIYGSGKHAEYLLKRYKNIMGDINAKLIFIDTYKETFSEKYHNHDIINVNDIDTINISEIVILSYFYEEEMYNNIITRYGNKYNIHRIYNGDNEPLDSMVYLDIYNRLLNLYKNGRRRIMFINTPLHTNIGDHIIAYATMKFFKEFLPDYDVIEVTNKMYKENRNEIIYRTNVDDIIVITGGGFLGSLWPYSGQNVYDIIKDFPDNKIVILPQSIYFEDTEEGQRQKQLAYDLFTKHKDLTIFYREAISYNRSETIFKGKVKSCLMPDMALTLDYSQEQNPREGILLCLRNDKEGMLSEEEKTSIKNHFLRLGENIKETSMHWHSNIMPNQREEVINNKINELKKYKLVITDALHCMISCVISGTPCIAINNINRKLEGIYKSWLNDVKYIRFVKSYEDILLMNLDSWDEPYQKNYYYLNYMEQIANIICDNSKITKE